MYRPNLSDECDLFAPSYRTVGATFPDFSAACELAGELSLIGEAILYLQRELRCTVAQARRIAQHRCNRPEWRSI